MHILQQRILNLAQQVDLSKLGLRKLGNLLHEKWPQKVKHHLLQLEENGYVKLDTNKSRVIKVLKKGKPAQGSKLFRIPILGSANAGPATIYADQDVQGYLPISQTVLGRNSTDGLFAIRVVGDSLNRATDVKGGPVNNGDYVVVDSKVTKPSNGDYVLSVIDQVANLKRYYEDPKHREIRLVSESSLDIPPIVLHEKDFDSSDYLVNGKIIKVVKS
ncbi:MAG: LexA family protein [Patescibacteria group bacterium]